MVGFRCRFFKSGFFGWGVYVRAILTPVFWSGHARGGEMTGICEIETSCKYLQYIVVFVFRSTW